METTSDLEHGRRRLVVSTCRQRIEAGVLEDTAGQVRHAFFREHRVHFFAATVTFAVAVALSTGFRLPISAVVSVRRRHVHAADGGHSLGMTMVRRSIAR